ncbi:hypothetical protein GCM10017600_64240 [Streptosporangium carneum]|uniref:Uncharacterized protein n=1 Tax=Streptosporangium carneum TaxID=47481 RepID=A0A9W6I873_9ACTN|nr:hypothetical protein GCM10017600_64240 [Streptosporangium carneum]
MDVMLLAVELQASASRAPAALAPPANADIANTPAATRAPSVVVNRRTRGDMKGVPFSGQEVEEGRKG